MSENQRVRLSKRMLKDSLTHLLHEESIHKISVRDICEGAQINRTTFYKYYGSQYDLLAEMENDILTQIEVFLGENIGDADDSLRQLTSILAFLYENIDLCGILLNNNVDPEFPEKLLSLPSIRRHLAHLKTGSDEGELEYIFGFIISGGFDMVKRWINNDSRESPGEMAVLLGNTIMKLVSS